MIVLPFRRVTHRRPQPNARVVQNHARDRSHAFPRARRRRRRSVGVVIATNITRRGRNTIRIFTQDEFVVVVIVRGGGGGGGGMLRRHRRLCVVGTVGVGDVGDAGVGERRCGFVVGRDDVSANDANHA